LHRRPAGFANALVQNIAAGNTIALRGPALALARAAARDPAEVVVHDWWVYQLLTGAGARVIYDAQPVLLYRQHRGNLIGANRGPLASLRRLRHLFTGTFQRWNEINLAALAASAHHLTPQNRDLLGRFAAGRAAGPLGRLAMLRATGVYRQGKLGEASLRLAALLGRL
ncbi:MAG: glycosyltransferase, partial [Salipiger marinus]